VYVDNFLTGIIANHHDDSAICHRIIFLT